MSTHLLLNDVLFGIVFGTQANSRILQALLNALLGLKGQDRIVNLKILSPRPEQQHLLQKGVILDVVARDGRSRLFNIEVQVYSEAAFVKRSFYYLTRLGANSRLPSRNGFRSSSSPISTTGTGSLSRRIFFRKKELPWRWTR
ncbi:MAG: PD-(D/E)XK nuclease family transposase [Candidatus Eremiobacterota bacterium]